MFLNRKDVLYSIVLLPENSNISFLFCFENCAGDYSTFWLVLVEAEGRSTPFLVLPSRKTSLRRRDGTTGESCTRTAGAPPGPLQRARLFLLPQVAPYPAQKFYGTRRGLSQCFWLLQGSQSAIVDLLILSLMLERRGSGHCSPNVVVCRTATLPAIVDLLIVFLVSQKKPAVSSFRLVGCRRNRVKFPLAAKRFICMVLAGSSSPNALSSLCSRSCGEGPEAAAVGE